MHAHERQTRHQPPQEHGYDQGQPDQLPTPLSEAAIAVEGWAR